MGAFFRVCFLPLIFAFLISSCNPAGTSTPSANPLAVTPVPKVASETPSVTAIPKQNDLIFIEFFAGT
jgi:hypothetical protein